MRVRVLAVVLLAACSCGSQSPAPLESRPYGGFVDVGRAPDEDPRLERLVAEERFSEALSLAVSHVNERLDAAGPDDLSTLRALRRAGVVSHRAEEDRFATLIFDAILPSLRQAGPEARAELVETLIRRGYMARYQGDRALAAALYDEARARLREGPRDARREGFLEQAYADWTRGINRSRSIQLYERALSIRRGSADVPWFSIANNEVWIAWTLVREDRWEEARVHVEEARRILNGNGVTEHTLQATLDDIDAQDLAIHGRHPEALAAYRRASERAERGRQRFPPGVPRAALAAEGLNALAVDAIRNGLDEHAWELREQGLGIVHAELAWLGHADRVDPTAAARMRNLAHEMLDATRACERAPSARTIVRMLEAKIRLDEGRTSFLEAHPLPQPSLTRLQEHLDARSAIIGSLDAFVGSYATSSTQWAFVIRHDRPIRWVHLRDTKGPAEWHAWHSLLFGMDRIARAAGWPERVLGDPELEASLVERSGEFFEPMRPYLDGVERLIVEGNTALVPEIFVGGDGRYLTDQFEVVHVPSAATLEILGEERAAERAATSVLTVAAGPPARRRPTLAAMLSGPEAMAHERLLRTAFLRTRGAVPDLPSLPFAPVETASIAELFPTAVRLENASGNDARLASLAASGEIGRFDVVHVAGHTLVDPWAERGAIVVGRDGLLSVEDVALSWSLRARLITLSACESIISGGVLRGEPLGFTPASLAAGAENVLSSAWPVEDRATAILMRRFYEDLNGRYDGERRGRRGPMPAAAALSEAKSFVHELRDPSGARPFEHPAYWAGWMLIGTGN